MSPAPDLISTVGYTMSCSNNVHDAVGRGMTGVTPGSGQLSVKQYPGRRPAAILKKMRAISIR